MWFFFLERISTYKGLILEALTSHLSSADDPDSHFTEVQIHQFKKAIEIGHAMGFDLPLNNLANSAGVMAHKNSHFNLVRPGIMLYGGLPSPGFKNSLPLKTAMGFKGQILQIRDLPGQTPISYGRTYHTKGRQRIAVLSAGYGDGLPRSLSNRGKVLVGGRKVQIVGRVCMNMMMADVTGMTEVLPGSEVLFLGTQGDEIITGDQMAKWSETISYEIFCSIGQRNFREYVS
ncbi:MAG: alanine racemase [Pseudomonadota bacterium]